jgi:hypothetical protein
MTQRRNSPQPIAGPDAASIAAMALGWVATAGLMGIVVLRCIAVFTPQLYWVGDPRYLADDIPETAFGPVGSAVTDLICVALLGVAVMARALRHQAVARWLLTLWFIGCQFAFYHALHNFESLRIGLDWIGATAAGLTAYHLGGAPVFRRVMIACLIAAVLPLAAEAGSQVTYEHRQTVQDYQKRKPQILAERGWQEGSLEQRKFEERLFQLEATGRFGFSNIFGSIMMGLTLMAAGVAVAIARGDRRRAMMVGAIVVLGLAGTAVSFSKGATLALLVGVALLAALRFIVAARRVAPSLGVALIVLGIGAVVARGMAGEPATASGERSLLFRWHYMQAAARMAAQDPVAGVGPGEFQEKYLLYKNPKSPEEIMDPHGMVVASLSTLGLGGAAWCGVLGTLLVFAGQRIKGTSITATGDTIPTADSAWSTSAVVVAAGIAFGVQMTAEWPRYWFTPLPIAVWLLSAAWFVALARMLAADKAMEEWWTHAGLFAAAAALALHGQIEMSMTNGMSAPLIWCVIGVAAARVPERAVVKRAALWALPLIWAAVLAMLLLFMAAPLIEYEWALEKSEAALRHHDLRGAIGWLREAHVVQPHDVKPWISESRLFLEQAIMAQRNGDPAGRDAALGNMAAALDQGIVVNPESSALRRALVMHDAEAFKLIRQLDWQKRALAALRPWLDRDPFGITAHQFAADLAWDAGHLDLARPWYRRVLELSDLVYLDPNKQLTEAERKHIRERLAVSPKP